MEKLLRVLQRYSQCSEYIMFNHVEMSAPLKELESKTTGNGRVYVTPEGKKYPSITTVLSLMSRDAIQAWRKRVGEEVANKISVQAGTRGTAVHQLAEDYVNNNPDWAKKAMPANLFTFNSIKPLLDKHLNNVWIQEAPLYSDRLEIAGRVDCIAEWDGELAIIDYKTSRRPKTLDKIQNYLIQESVYAACFYELTGIPIKKIVTVIAVDDSEPQVFIDTPYKYLPKFLEVREQFRRERGF